MGGKRKGQTSYRTEKTQTQLQRVPCCLLFPNFTCFFFSHFLQPLPCQPTWPSCFYLPAPEATYILNMLNPLLSILPQDTHTPLCLPFLVSSSLQPFPDLSALAPSLPPSLTNQTPFISTFPYYSLSSLLGPIKSLFPQFFNLRGLPLHSTLVPMFVIPLPPMSSECVPTFPRSLPTQLMHALPTFESTSFPPVKLSPLISLG